MDRFSYTFLAKTPEHEATRRSGLDWHANVAQFSQLFIIVAIPWITYAMKILIRRRRGSDATGKESTSNSGREGRGTTTTPTRTPSDSLELFFGREVAQGRGTYGQWFFAVGWAAWMGYLCFHDTAPDYLHLVKRFGVVGASQLPIHYLLSTSHPYAPLEYLLPKRCRRQLLLLHFVTGRLIILFVAIHATLYSGIFIQLNVFWASIRQTKIIVALLGLAILGTIAVTSLRGYRRKAHSIFRIIHLVGSTAIPPLLYFHVSHIRLYVLECAIVVCVNAIRRVAKGQGRL